MHRGAQHLVAGPADAHPAALAGLAGHRGHAGVALQSFHRGKQIAVSADLAQQPRSELLTSAGQRAKQIVIGMLGKKLVDPRPILLQPPLQRQQLLGQRHRQKALGRRHRGDWG